MSYLLDTNVVSEFRKGSRGNPHVLTWIASVAGRELYLSVITIGELTRGAERLRGRDEVGAATIARWVRSVAEGFSERILPISRPVAEEWGRITAARSLPQVDALLAATARVHSLTLVTRNVRDLAPAGVHCLNPFVEE